MKIALYIEDEREQIVLTPSSDTEKAILDNLHENKRVLSIERGSFYECQGGWIRQAPRDTSTILVLSPLPEPKEQFEVTP